jgi:hypothetical protein
MATGDTIPPVGRGKMLDQSNNMTDNSGAGTRIQKKSRNTVARALPGKNKLEKSRCPTDADGVDGRKMADTASAPGHEGDVDARAQSGCCNCSCSCFRSFFEDVDLLARAMNSCRVKSAWTRLGLVYSTTSTWQLRPYWRAILRSDGDAMIDTSSVK